jgi:hypothetical protein
MSRNLSLSVTIRVTVRPQHCPLKLNKIHNLYVKCNTARLLSSRVGLYVQRTVHPPLLGNLYFVTCYNLMSLFAAQKIGAVIVFSSSSFKLANGNRVKSPYWLNTLNELALTHSLHKRDVCAGDTHCTAI